MLNKIKKFIGIKEIKIEIPRNHETLDGVTFWNDGHISVDKKFNTSIYGPESTTRYFYNSSSDTFFRVWSTYSNNCIYNNLKVLSKEDLEALVDNYMHLTTHGGKLISPCIPEPLYNMYKISIDERLKKIYERFLATTEDKTKNLLSDLRNYGYKEEVSFLGDCDLKDINPKFILEVCSGEQYFNIKLDEILKYKPISIYVKSIEELQYTNTFTRVSRTSIKKLIYKPPHILL